MDGYAVSATDADYPPSLCVHQLFERQVARDPDAVAVVAGDQSLTYGALNARCNRLAHHLRELGVRPDDRVAISVERSLEMVIGLVAVLKAGGAYVPLDPSHPAERLAYIVEESRPIALLTHGPARATLESVAARLGRRPPILDVEADAVLWAGQPVVNPDAAHGLTPAHLAYVIYTSGSTGAPKGVMTEHRSLTNRLQWMQDAYGLRPKDIVLQKTPFGFDVSVWEFFWTLGWGARLVIAPPGSHRDPGMLTDVVRRHDVTTMHFVPSLLQAFLQHPDAGTCVSLTRVICSGEALPLSSMTLFHETLASAKLHNLYGPTEAAIDVTAWTSAGQLPAGAASPPIGRPIANTRVALLDSSLRPVPAGVTGEIHIAGICLARGYVNRSALTATRFVANPFGNGDRLYKTGDIGRYLPDGNIEFLGRNDHQVKLRGHRIEPREIEAVLSANLAVRDAVVIAREDAPGHAQLVAYYTSSSRTAEPVGEDLRAQAAARLPDYMVPTAYVHLDQMPLTANGKLDRGALPAPFTSGHRAHYVPPRTPEEILVCSLAADLLGLDRAGLTDNFFHLGGHSILAAQLAVQVGVRLGRELSVRAIFESPVLGDLVRRIGTGATSTAAFEVLLPIRREGTLPPLFCFHPVGGLCWPYTTLLHFTLDAQPIYGIQALGHEPGRDLPTSMNEILESCLAAIRRVAPAGPIRLLGWSFGGLLAHLAGTRLQTEGREIARLMLFDAYPPASMHDASDPVDPRSDWLWRDLAFGLDLVVPPEVRDGALDGPTVMSLARQQSHTLAVLSLHQLERFAAVMANNTRLMPTMTFERFDGDVTFVAARRRAAGFEPVLMTPEQWQPCCAGAITTLVIDSTHNRMLTPESLKQIGFLATPAMASGSSA